MKHFFIPIFLFLFSISFAQEDNLLCRHFDEEARIRERVVDFETMVLHIDFDTKQKKVFGNVQYKFSPIRKYVSTLTLDAPAIKINEVLLDGKKCKFTQNETDLILVFNDTNDETKGLKWETDHTLEIDYETQPEKGLYFLGFEDETNRAKKQIWTQGQGIDNRYWIPSFDDVSDKLITETYITFENGFEVISNGDLIDKTPAENNKTTWHYKMQHPHVVYLVMIAIGEYDYKDIVSKRGITSRQYYYKESPEQFDYSYQYSAEMMDWMEKEFGVNYPWGKIYRNVPVVDFLYGAMENTTSTIFTDFYLKDSRTVLERDYIGTNAHELTHQWFGDYITEWNSTSHWLHESFATQYAKHFKKSLDANTDDYEWERVIEMRRAMNADDKNEIPIAHSKAGSARHYPKGSIVIDMLRNAAGGEEQYQKVITKYLKKYGFKNVDTHLFELEFMETLGLNLDWFFDQWIYKGGYPHFEISYKELTDKIELQVNQIQEQTKTIGVFKVQPEIYIAYQDGSNQTIQPIIDSVESTISITNKENKKVSYIVFDVGNQIYKKITFKRTPEELIAQAQTAPLMIDRYFAVSALEDVDVKEKRKALIEIFNKETFYSIKGNIVKQLADDDHKKSKELVLSALKNENHLVRRAPINYVQQIDEKNIGEYEKLLLDSSYVNIELALNKLVKQFPENTDKYLAKTKADANKNKDLKIAWLSIAVNNGNEEALTELIDFTSQSFDFRTRIKAMQSLNEMQLSNQNYLENLINATSSFNSYLSNTAKKYLIEMSAEETVKKDILSLIKSKDFDRNEQKKIDSLLEKMK